MQQLHKRSREEGEGERNGATDERSIDSDCEAFSRRRIETWGEKQSSDADVGCSLLTRQRSYNEHNRDGRRNSFWESDSTLLYDSFELLSLSNQLNGSILVDSAGATLHNLSPLVKRRRLPALSIPIKFVHPRCVSLRKWPTYTTFKTLNLQRHRSFVKRMRSSLREACRFRNCVTCVDSAHVQGYNHVTHHHHHHHHHHCSHHQGHLLEAKRETNIGGAKLRDHFQGWQ